MANSGIDHRNYKHGFRAGYTEWRYGSGTPRKRQDPIFSKDQYEVVVTRIMALMADWKSSPFQNEAACRHGLRQQLCMKGFSWGRSDAEAARIVADSLSRLRAVRPTHDQGQPEYVVSTDYCLRCYRTLDDHQLTMKHRFCSKECAQATIVFRNYEVGYWADQIGQAAFLIVQRAKYAPRDCRHCGQVFRPKAEDSTQVYCSTACSSAARVVVPDCTCEGCGRTFHRAVGSKKTPRYCSRGCADEARRNYEERKRCAFCDEPFVAGGKKAKFCSTACAVASSKMSRGWQPRELSRHVFDHFVVMPVTSHPTWLSAERFDEMMKAA